MGINLYAEGKALRVMPSIDVVDRFEVIDEHLYDTQCRITSANKNVVKELFDWITMHSPLSADPNWQGAYRPILVIKIWLTKEQNPKEISFTHEWKDAQGRVQTLDESMISSLIENLLKASKRERQKGS